MTNFCINITNHHWIDNKVDNVTDTCSHGKFTLTIAGQEILSEADKIQDWTTSTSVLRLLRTIDNDFVLNRDAGIILHCGMLMMLSCPIAIDWILTHQDDKVIIKDIKKYLTTNEKDVIEFPELVATIDLAEYKREILKVAKQVKDFFNQTKQRVVGGDQYDIEEYKKFWIEFDGLVEKHT